MQIEILDSNLNVVGHVIIYGGHGTIQSVALSTTTFIPETQNLLSITANQGAMGSFNGKGLDNITLLPNGLYHVHLTQSGQPPIDVTFWIQHAQYSAGWVVAFNNPVPAGSPLILKYSFPQTVSLEARVYNIAGELVCLGDSLGNAGEIRMTMRTSGGRNASAGIYLIQIRGQVTSSGAAILKSIKVAVVW
jgi:hypothetical protein